MAKKLVPVTGTAPSAWVGYLINGDASGISEEDIKRADRFQKWMVGPIVSCEDAGFLWSSDGLPNLGADCQTYTALVEQDDNKENPT